MLSVIGTRQSAVKTFSAPNQNTVSFPATCYDYTFGRLLAQHGELFGKLRNIRAVVAQVADLDVAGAEVLRRIQQQLARLIGSGPAMVLGVPVQQPLDFDLRALDLRHQHALHQIDARATASAPEILLNRPA